MSQSREPIDENAPVILGCSPVMHLVVPAEVCRSLTRPVDYAVYLHFCLASEEQARNWGAPGRTVEDLWRRMAGVGLLDSSGQPITHSEVVESLRRLQAANLLHVDSGDGQ